MENNQHVNFKIKTILHDRSKQKKNLITLHCCTRLTYKHTYNIYIEICCIHFVTSIFS